MAKVTAFTASNIIMHIILISVFIGIFFFTYGTYIEREVLKSQVDFFVDDLLGVFKPMTSKLPKEVINKIKDFEIPVVMEEDKIVAKKNEEVKMQAAMGIVTLLVVGLIIITIFLRKLDRKGMTKGQIWKKLLKQNLIIIIFVGLTEFVCINMFVKKYMSVDTNKVKKGVIDHLIAIRDNTHKVKSSQTNNLQISPELVNNIQQQVQQQVQQNISPELIQQAQQLQEQIQKQ